MSNFALEHVPCKPIKSTSRHLHDPSSPETSPRVIASALAQLNYLKSAYDTADVTYSLWPVVLCNQIVQNIGIITACVPYTKPFLESLESGMIRTDDLRRRGLTTAYGYSSSSNSSGGKTASAYVSSHQGSSQQPLRAAGGGTDRSTAKTIV